jgi:hypothetical protein
MRPHILRIVLIAYSMLLAAGAPWAAASPPPALSGEKRVALIVGDSVYRYVTPLGNPKNDARLVADTLRSLGFKLVGDGPQLDLDKAGIDRVVQQFGVALQGADVGLFYFAGHGMQVRGSNYLVPVDANPAREADIDFQMLDANLVLRQMAYSGTKLNIVLLDACRNNPFGGHGLRASNGGLAEMQAPEGTLISFATQPGNVALDGADDSPYSRALAEVMRRPGLDVFRTFNEVGLAVSSATGGQQQPWLSLSPIKGDFYFSGSPAAATDRRDRNPEPDTGQTSCEKQVDDKAGKEAILAANVDGSVKACAQALEDHPNEPRLIELLQSAHEQQAFQRALRSKEHGPSLAYLDLYPNGRYAEDVRQYLASLAVGGPDQWLTMPELQAVFNQRFPAGYYPDLEVGRCEEGVVKYHAHWTPRSPGLGYWIQAGMTESNFNAQNAYRTSQGYVVQFQNTFKGCDGLARYQALWTKSLPANSNVAVTASARPAYAEPGVPNMLCTQPDVGQWDNCVGTHTYSNGNVYRGEFHYGRREGFGVIAISAKGVSDWNGIRSNERSEYIGEFRGDRLNGHGVWFTASGAGSSNTFVNNISSEASQRSCSGPPSSAWTNCVGMFRYPNGNVYRGEFVQGLSEGVGLLEINATGASDAGSIRTPVPGTYIGEFRGGRLNGHGVTMLPDAGFYGLFKDNMFTSAQGQDSGSSIRNERGSPGQQNGPPATSSPASALQPDKSAEPTHPGLDGDLLDFSALRSGQLTVWVSGPSYSPTIAASFARDFPQGKLVERQIPPDDFLDAVAKAPGDDRPDMAFIDNHRQFKPILDSNTAWQVWGVSRFPINGWWVIFKDTNNLARAQAFARWLNRSPNLQLQAKNLSMPANARDKAQGVATNALKELMTANLTGLDQYLDKDAARGWTPNFGLFAGSGSEAADWRAQSPLTFGNSKIAFVMLPVAVSNDKVYGMRHINFLLRNQSDGWRILYMYPDVKMSDGKSGLGASGNLGFVQSFDDAITADQADSPPPAAVLIDPPDGAELPRFPERPIISWRSESSANAAFIVESQFGWSGDHWSPSYLTFAEGARLTQPFSERAPFGQGRQPHRWRIWTLDRSGEVSLSEWRTINFTN